MIMLGRLVLACLACGARGYSAPARPGPARLARSHGPAMGLTLPPMPTMPEGLPRLDGIGSLPPLPGLPSLPEDQPPWAMQMWVDLLDLIGAIGGAVTSGRDGSPGSGGRLPMPSRRGRPSGIVGIGGSVRPMAGPWERANRAGPGLAGAEYPRAPHARHARTRRPNMII